MIGTVGTTSAADVSYTRCVWKGKASLRHWTLGNRHPKRNRCKRNKSERRYWCSNVQHKMNWGGRWWVMADASSSRNWVDSENIERRCVLTFAAHAENFSTASAKATFPILSTYTHCHHWTIDIWLMCYVLSVFAFATWRIYAMFRQRSFLLSPPSLPSPPLTRLFFFSLRIQRARFLRDAK